MQGRAPSAPACTPVRLGACAARLLPINAAPRRRHAHERPAAPPLPHGRRAAAAAAAAATAAAAPSIPDADCALAADLSHDADYARFVEAASRGNLVPLYDRLLADHLTPVAAYRCLVSEDDREAPSFLFESVVAGTQQGRYSFVGAHPSLEIIAHGDDVQILDHGKGSRQSVRAPDPMQVPIDLSADWRAVPAEGLPRVFTGGWVGYCGYDTVRYVYAGKLPFASAPPDDRALPDLHLALYTEAVVFDHATKLAYVVTWVRTDGPGGGNGKEESGAQEEGVEAAYRAGRRRLAALTAKLTGNGCGGVLGGARVSLALNARPEAPKASNMSREQFLAAVAATKEHIQAGDVFQLVLSHRFERRTFADPFEIYRSLRVVNPSPYMAYLQARGSIVVASSPEILCRVDEGGVVTNRPLAGTRRRGATPADDAALEAELLADEKECAEHVMLVDLGRNDVGRVAQAGSVVVEKLMEVERYSHVMHISSTVTGRLREGLSAWDALRAALPAGTVSGAPKVRAMQIIDELEVAKRGPYGGGIGHVSFTGGMDMALALRTMVIPTAARDTLYSYAGDKPRREWVVHLQAGAGLVADSDPSAEWEETVNKAAALGRAIDLAEQAFVGAEQAEQ